MPFDCHVLYVFKHTKGTQRSLLCIYLRNVVLADTLAVRTVACVDTDHFAFVDEERNAYLSAGFNRSRLEGVGSGIAFQTRLRIGNGQLYLRRQLCEQYRIRRCVRYDIYVHSLFQEINTGDQIVRDGYLLESLVVHEDVVLALFVQELIRTALYADIFQFLTDVEAALQYAAIHYIFEFNTHNCVTLTRFNVKELNYEIQTAIHADTYAVFNVLTVDHINKNYRISRKSLQKYNFFCTYANFLVILHSENEFNRSNTMESIQNFFGTIDFWQVVSSFIFLIAIIDPFGNIPVTITMEKEGIRIVPWRVCLASLIILMAFLFLGEWILKLFGVQIEYFAIAGGFVIFLMALEMILDISIFKNGNLLEGEGSIVPLAFPMYAGPGAFTALLAITAEYSIASLCVSLILCIVTLYLVLVGTNWLTKYLGQTSLYIIRKFFGIIVLAIACKLMFGNLAAIF